MVLLRSTTVQYGRDINNKVFEKAMSFHKYFVTLLFCNFNISAFCTSRRLINNDLEISYLLLRSNTLNLNRFRYMSITRLFENLRELMSEDAIFSERMQSSQATWI